MNRKRRQLLKTARSRLTSVKDLIGLVYDGELDALQNRPESFMDTDEYQASEAACDALDEVKDALGEIEDRIDDIVSGNL